MGGAGADPPYDDYCQDDSSYDHCYVGIAEGADNALDDKAGNPVAPYHSVCLSSGIESPTSMAKFHTLPISPIPTTIDHWVELCRGGIIADLSVALANGITIKTITLLEKIMMVRYMATARLRALQHQHPALLSQDAIDHPLKVDQDVTKIATEDFRPFPPVTVIFATPPCKPLSKAGPTPGWDTNESKPFISFVNLIKALSSIHGGNITYTIENVPISARFPEITNALGPIIIVKAHKLGSSALTKTMLWTNASAHDFLLQHYENNHHPGNKVPLFLDKHGFADWRPIAYTWHYFPTFMARAGS